MKRFIIKIGIIAVVFLGLAVFGEISLRRIPNDYSFKKGWLDQHAQEVEILIYGASDSYFGINPEFLTYKAFNVSHVSQSLGYEKFIFDKYLDVYDSLKYVIIAVHYVTPWGMLEKGVESWRCKNYNIYYGDTVYRFDPKFNFKIMDFSPMNFARIIKSGRGYSEIAVDENGFGTAYTLKNRKPNWKETAKQDAKGHTLSNLDAISERYVINQEYLYSIIETCDSLEVKVLLVTVPVCKEYRAALDEKQLKLQRKFCNDAVKKFDNVTYLDFLDETSFDDDDFFDPGHMTEIGAKKLTLMISDSIMKYENVY